MDGVCSRRSSSLARYVLVTGIVCARTSDVGRTKAIGCVESGRDVGCCLLELERLVDGSWRFADPFRFRGCALDHLREDDRVLQCQVRRLLEESLSDLVVKAASDEAVATVFELDGTEFAVVCQSLELGDKVEYVVACLLGTAMKLGVGVDD